MSNLENTPEIIDAEAPNNDGDAEIDEIVEELVGLGRMWAKHGITIGKMALKSSATTLEVTSGVLEKLARRVGPREASKV